MPICSQCGVEHDIMDPTFARPEAYVRLGARNKAAHAQADDDLCAILVPDTASRFFVRGILAVHVDGFPQGVRWGLWAEISQSALARVVERWDDPQQADEPPFSGLLANVVPTYPDTLGIPLVVRLTGPTTRPSFQFAPGVVHPFAEECLAGVSLHRVREWNSIFGGN
jgi:hypothetical protein